MVSAGQPSGSRPEASGDAAAIRRVVATVVDPEIPVLTIEDLGVLRDVAIDDDGVVVVTITPTYSGCPAMQLIEDQIALTLDLEGFAPYRIQTVYAPAWTTDWMSDEAKDKLRSVGIAPPPQASGFRPQASGDSRSPLAGGKYPQAAGLGVGGLRKQDDLHDAQVGDETPLPASRRSPQEPSPLRGDPQPVLCPRCSSDDTRTVSEFGSTACKALMVCSSCREPFDLFKEL